MKIVKINQHNFTDMNKANELFEIIGKIKPVFIDGIWTYTEEIYKQSDMKVYPNDTWDYAAYINNSDKIIYLAYSDAGCVGQIVMKRDWNRYAFY